MKPETLSFRRRNLPHWHVKDRAYFVTIRLKGSLPKNVIYRYKLEYELFLLEKERDEDEVQNYRRRHFRRVERLLDRAADGPLHLRNKQIATLVMNAFQWIEHNHNWRIPSAVVMPNHVHMLMVGSERATKTLAKSLGILKGYTAREANKILGSTGKFWMSENFDYWCRSAAKEEQAIRYIRNNPVKAGFVAKPEDWPWLRE